MTTRKIRIPIGCSSDYPLIILDWIGEVKRKVDWGWDLLIGLLLGSEDGEGIEHGGKGVAHGDDEGGVGARHFIPCVVPVFVPLLFNEGCVRVKGVEQFGAATATVWRMDGRALKSFMAVVSDAITAFVLFLISFPRPRRCLRQQPPQFLNLLRSRLS